MRTINKILAGVVGVAALGSAAPSIAQYYDYGRHDGYRYGYNAYDGYAVNTRLAQQQCTAAVQSRLYNRTSIGGILGAFLGTSTRGQVLSVTQVAPRGNGMVRVRGLATSGRYASNYYGPYGAGAYGALGYGYASAADLSFRCDVAPNGAVYSVSINRR
jgi:hypothetical protein